MQLRNRNTATDEGAAPAAKDDTPAVEPSSGEAVGATLISIVTALASTIFSTDATTSLNRSAIFLIFFLVVHMLGNLFIFAGPEAFNTYGYFLHINPLLKFIEAYLALGFVIHAGAGFFKTYKKANSIAKAPLTQGRLLISSLVVTGFVILHLKTFKFGAYYKHIAAGGFYIPLKGSVEQGTEMRDIYKLALEVFSDPIKVWIYIISIGVLGMHMWWGWEKTIKNNYSKMGLKKEHQKMAILFGHAVILPLTIGFISSPVYVHFVLLPGQNA
jgi:succinate dehydrogenase / fumarate reductase cytochrome b subunit